MGVVHLLLLAFAFVFFALATFNVASKWNLIAAGLAAWVLAVLLGGLPLK